ncbi:MAG: hypothetical protein DRO09_03865 [Thermoprotei archaeon]|nr:MAG: hypothetical protein DRO09_03865 [Thermoprotei archaeon]
MIALMIDGRAYTKEDIFAVISRLDTNITRMGIDRHVRTLEHYGVIKPYAPVKRDSKGRRPLAYIMVEDARKFMISLLTYITGSEVFIGPKGVLRSLVAKLCLEVVKRAILTYYLLPKRLSKGEVKEIKGVVNELALKLALQALTQTPTEPLRTCDEARDFLRAICRNSYLCRVITPEKIQRIVMASAISSGAPKGCVDSIGSVAGCLPKIIEEIVRNSATNEDCCNLVIDIANSLKTYLASSWLGKHGIYVR